MTARKEEKAAGLYVETVDGHVPVVMPRVPLQKVVIEAHVVDANVLVTVKQEYYNPTDDTVSTLYLFPLDNKAGVHEFSATINGRKIKGAVKEKEEAAKEFEKARKEGKTAALLSRCAEDTFQCKIGNLPAKTACFIEVCYVAEMRLVDNVMELHLPTSLAPRYSPTDMILGGARVDSLPPVMLSDDDDRVKLRISAHFVAASAIGEINCASHRVRILPQKSPNETIIELCKEREVGLETNFVVKVATEKPFEPRALVAAGAEGEAIVQMVFSPAQVPLTELTELAMEIIFVIDRSGSMQGNSIASVIECMRVLLRSLSTQSRFNLVSFGSTFVSLFKESVPYSQATLEQATKHVLAWQADLGGTEMRAPLHHVFSTPPLPTHPRQIFLLTDGEVSNVEELTALVGMHAASTRVSVLGIGNGVSRSLVENLARAGKGTSAFITDNEEVGPKVSRMMQYLTQPCLFDLRITNAEVVRQFSSSGPIYGHTMGFFYAIFAKGQFPVDGVLVVSARTNAPTATGHVEFKMTPCATTADVIQKQAAIALLANLEHDYALLSGRPFTLIHPNHPGHAMMKSTKSTPWVCDGCKVSAKTSPARYRCTEQECDYDLCVACWGDRSFPEEVILQKYKNDSIQVSLQHQVLCKWTSSVLVYEDGLALPAAALVPRMEIREESLSGACGASGSIGLADGGRSFFKKSKSAARGSKSAMQFFNSGAAEEEEEEGEEDEACESKTSSRGAATWTSLWWVTDLLALQKANGSWEWSDALFQILTQCPPPLPTEIAHLMANPKSTPPSSLITDFILALLHKYASSKQDQWLMIEAKAQKWLSRSSPVLVF